MRIKYICFVAILVSWAAMSERMAAQEEVQQPSTFTLDEAQQYAVENNVKSKNAELTYQKAKKRANEIITQGLPKLNGEVSYQNNYERPTTLVPAEFFGGPEGEFIETKFGTKQNVNVSGTATQLIVDGRYFIGLQANETLLQMNKNMQRMEERDVRYEVEKAFYSALVAEETVDAIEKNLATVKKTLRETRAQYNSGFVEELDVDRLKLSMNNLSTRVENAKVQQELAFHVLKYKMGYPLEDSIVIEQELESFMEGDKQQISYEYDHRNRLEYKILQDRASMREFDRKQVLASYYPSMNAYVSYEQSAQRDEFNFLDFDKEWYPSGQFGIQLDIPIFDSFEKGFRAQQKKIERQQLLNRLDNFENTASVEVKRARTEYIQAKNNLDNQEQNLELAQKVYDKTTTKYNEGVGSSLEVSNAESSLTESQANYINAVYNYLMAKAKLKKAKGGY